MLVLWRSSIILICVSVSMYCILLQVVSGLLWAWDLMQLGELRLGEA